MDELNAELRRPVTLGLLVVALVGWVLCIWAFAASHSEEDVLRDQLTALRTDRDSANDELSRQRQAAGSLQEIAAKRDAAESDAKKAQVLAQEANKTRAATTATVSDLQGQIKGLTDQQTKLRQDTAGLVSARDQASADLDAVRQQNETLRQAFAKASDQLAQQNSQLADLNDKVQKARAQKAEEDAAQADANGKLAKAQGDLKTLIDQRAATEQAVAQLTSQNLQLEHTRSDLDTRSSAAQEKLDGLTAALAAATRQVSDATAKLATMQAQETQVEGSRQALATQVADLQKQAADLQKQKDQLAGLQADIARATDKLAVLNKQIADKQAEAAAKQGEGAAAAPAGAATPAPAAP